MNIHESNLFKSQNIQEFLEEYRRLRAAYKPCESNESYQILSTLQELAEEGKGAVVETEYAAFGSIWHMERDSDSFSILMADGFTTQVSPERVTSFRIIL